MFNPNCRYYERRYGKMFGSCSHPKMRGWFGRKLCVLPDKECKLQEEYPRPKYKPRPLPLKRRRERGNEED